MMKLDAKICAICKGKKMLCGAKKCIILETKRQKYKIKRKARKTDIYGKNFDLFVSSDYPNINAGPVMLEYDEWDNYIEQKNMYGKQYENIIDFRMISFSLSKNVNIRHDKLEDIYLSTRPIDIEAYIKQRNAEPIFSKHFSPIGIQADLKDLKVCENAKIPKKVDSIIEENLKAEQGLNELYEHRFDNYYLTKIFSGGFLGQQQNKRIVPTRWSITAVDDILSKKLIKKIKEYSVINDIYVYQNEFLFNHFEIILFPKKFSFELFECWLPKSLWVENNTQSTIIYDFESYEGRTKYANAQGGYYASRLASLEALEKMRKQAAVVVIREVYPGYILPVGVWQIRENIRNAFKKKPRKMDKQELYSYLKEKIKTNVNRIVKKSRIINQSNLLDFF